MLTLVAAAVTLASGLVSALSMTRIAVEQTRSQVKLVAETLYHQARRVILAEPAADLDEALAHDPALRSYVQAVVGYSEVVVYLAILDDEDRALLHSDPTRQRDTIPSAETIDAFMARPATGQLWRLTQEHRVLVYDLPFSVDGRQPFGRVRVAVSTLLMREQIHEAILSNVAVAAVAVVAVFLAAFWIANRLLAPLDVLRRELRRIEVGGDRPPLELRNVEDANRVAEFFGSLTRQLREERQQRGADPITLDATLAGLSDAVFVVNARRELVSFNRSARDLLGVGGSPGDRSIESILDEGHPLRELLSEALESGEPVGPRQVAVPTGDGDRAQRVVALILRDGDRITGAVVTCSDLDRLARLGDRLSHAQKLAALGELTSGVAHEIKNPLNAMVLHLELLRESLDETAVQTHVEVIEREIRRLEQVVDGFLKFSRPDRLALESVPVERVVDDVLGLLGGRVNLGRISIRRRIPAGLAPVFADADLLRQVFLNLFLNACEAMPDGGTLEVEAESGADHRVVVSVRDDGRGIPPKILPEIFKLFCTTKPSGSGVGLSLVYRIVQLHGGTIEVESREGEGTCFRISLPEDRA